MPGSKRGRGPYPPEFRREAVQLYRRSGKSLRVISEELGISLETLRSWNKQFEGDVGEREGRSSEERQELLELRKQEREILKRAAAFFARERSGECLPADLGGEGNARHHRQCANRSGSVLSSPVAAKRPSSSPVGSRSPSSMSASRSSGMPDTWLLAATVKALRGPRRAHARFQSHGNLLR